MTGKRSDAGNKGWLDRERAAAVLFEAAFTRDTVVASKYEITTRTIENYRRRLNTDVVLAALVAAKRGAFEQATRGLPPVLIEALERLDEMARLARAGQSVSAEDLESISEALRSVLGALPSSGALPPSARPRGYRPCPAHEKW
jgi:hypothetical protein